MGFIQTLGTPSTQVPCSIRVHGRDLELARTRVLCPNSGVSTEKKRVCSHSNVQ